MYEYLDKLNEAQRMAATHIDGPLLMIAGAGSGKTTTLINRVAYMVDSGIDPRSILMLTFTNAAAANMVEKAAKLSNSDCAKITACTFHSFCAMVLRRFYKEAGLAKDFTIITPPEEVEAVKLVKSRLGYAEDKEVLKASEIAEVYSDAINFMCSFGEALYLHCGRRLAGTDSERKVMSVIKEYISYKEANGMVTYDDLLYRMYKLLRMDSEREKISDEYRYICVDEYQDTNRIQEQIGFMLAKKYGNIAVVGDDYQSIYKFRGADVSNIIEFESRVRESIGLTAKRVVIDINYRSVDGILAIANEVMLENADFGFRKVMRGVKGPRPLLPSMVRPEDERAEASMVVAAIEKWLDEGNLPSEYAVLSRGSMETSLIEVMLTQKGIPYEKLGGVKFLEHQCNRDMLSFFKVFVNNSDELSWFHLLDIVPGIGDAYASAIVEELKTGGDLSGWAGKKFYQDLIDLMDFVRNRQRFLSDIPILKLFDDTKNKYFYLVDKKISCAKLKDEEKRREMYDQMNSDKEIVEVLKDMAVKYDRVSEFLDLVVLDATPQISDENSVVISTIHSSKGLEWEHVDILNCLGGMIPKGFDTDSYGIKRLSAHEKSEADEELRCLYVALTRAKSELTCYAPFGVRYAGKYFSRLCPYLESSERKALFSMSSASKNSARVYLNVPYDRKEEAKGMKAMWDRDRRLWFTYGDNPRLGELISRFG